MCDVSQTCHCKMIWIDLKWSENKHLSPSWTRPISLCKIYLCKSEPLRFKLWKAITYLWMILTLSLAENPPWWQSSRKAMCILRQFLCMHSPLMRYTFYISAEQQPPPPPTYIPVHSNFSESVKVWMHVQIIFKTVNFLHLIYGFSYEIVILNSIIIFKR